MQPNESVIEELHRRVGRNVLRFQAIELSLKLMLPYIHPDGAAKGTEAMRKYQVENVDGQTLGPLLKQFRSSISESVELWERGLFELRSARNQLVHDFYYKFDFAQANSVSAALEYLDKQYKESEEWFEILRVQSLVLLLILIETKPAVAAEYGQHREKLLAKLPPSLEFVVPSQPNRTAWGTTRIVKLLRLAEKERTSIDGLTLLSRAGAFIKRRAPDLNVKDYGLRNLKEILITSGLFHVFASNDGTIAYRANDVPVDTNFENAGALSFSLFFGVSSRSRVNG
jgi:hypothetical protein